MNNLIEAVLLASCIFDLSPLIWFDFFDVICAAGSKAPIKGNTTTNFIRMECDEGMQYCFESYNANFSIVTASCQNLNTESKMLDICKVSIASRIKDISVGVKSFMLTNKYFVRHLNFKFRCQACVTLEITSI